MIEFVSPEAFLLVPVVVLALRRRLLHPSRVVVALRLGLLLLLAALFARPILRGGEPGRDIVLVIDHSRSMPEDATATAREWAALLQRHQRESDRVRRVVFAERALPVEQPMEQPLKQGEDTTENGGEGARGERGVALPGGATRKLRGEGSDIASAIRTALALVRPDRPASILLISDGEATGADPTAAAREALRRGVRVDAIPVRRRGIVDVAIASLGVPGEVAAHEPFRFAAWIRSDRACPAEVRLKRDGKVIAEGVRDLNYGTTRVVLRDRLDRPGVARYELEVVAAGDRAPENNVARAFVRAVAPRRVLCVTPQGRQDRLTRSLRHAGVAIDVKSAAETNWLPPGLDSYAAVILENVPAGLIGRRGLSALASFVRDEGGGLLLTGGEASFGVGGYHKSPLDPILPVSLELKKELRKFGVAMALVLDRSGSMAMPVTSGETKMNLANLGALAALDLLAPLDSIAVIAVDSSSHLVVPLQQVGPMTEARDRIRRIESLGGGIFVSVALEAAFAQLRQAKQKRRHIVLFADANDAERPGNFEAVVPALRKKGVTLSVIGLGRKTDSDGPLLQRLAELGGGRAVFVEQAADLPRVFAQETIEVSRSAFVPGRVKVLAQPALRALGDFGGVGEFTPPPLDGFNAAHLRPKAQVALQTWDADAIPLLSFWNVGLGRCAAFLVEVDGVHTGAWRSWDPAGDLLVTLARWLKATEVAGPVFATCTREGHEAVVTVEVARGDESLLTNVRAFRLRPDGPTELLLRRMDARRMEARIPLRGDEIFRAVVRPPGNGGVLRLAPVRLPYSPEFEPRSSQAAGGQILGRLARITGGTIDPAPDAVWHGPRTGTERRPLDEACMWLALVLLLIEIAWRRLPRQVHRTRPAHAPASPAVAGKPRTSPSVPAAPKTSPTDKGGTGGVLGDVLERAKSRARRRR